MTPPTEQRQSERVREDSLAPRPETDIRLRWIDDLIRDWQTEAFAPVAAGAPIMNRAEMPAAGLRTLPKEPLDHDPEAVTYAREQAGLSKRAWHRCAVSR